jgi:hypothetical protein
MAALGAPGVSLALNDAIWAGVIVVFAWLTLPGLWPRRGRCDDDHLCHVGDLGSPHRASRLRSALCRRLLRLAKLRSAASKCEQDAGAVTLGRRSVNRSLSAFSPDEGITIDLESSRVLLATRALKCVNRRADPHIHKSDLFQHCLPGCTRQTAGNSSRPEIDVSDRSRRHGLAVGNVGKLQHACGTQNAMDLAKHRALIGA